MYLALLTQAHTPGLLGSGVADNPVYPQHMLFCPLQLPSLDSPAHCLVGVHTEAALVGVPDIPNLTHCSVGA